MKFSFGFGSLVGLLLFACAPPRGRALSARAPEQVPARFPAGASERVRSRNLDFPVEFDLPSKPAWVEIADSTWLVLRHEASGSELAVSTFRAERLVRKADCSERVRLARAGLPEPNDDGVIERRPVSNPVGFDNELVLGVAPDSDGARGYAMVVGADVGRCFAAIFTTHVSGPNMGQELAGRLSLVVDRVFASVRLRGIEERAVRRRRQAMPGTTMRPSGR